MPIVSFSERDIKRGTIVEPAWYRCKIEEVGEEPSKDRKSINYPIELTILSNSDTGSTEFADIPINYTFNSKALGFLKGLFAACGIDLEAGKRYDIASFAGQIVDVYIENELFDNRTVNRVNHKYRQAAQG